MFYLQCLCSEHHLMAYWIYSKSRGLCHSVLNSPRVSLPFCPLCATLNKKWLQHEKHRAVHWRWIMQQLQRGYYCFVFITTSSKPWCEADHFKSFSYILWCHGFVLQFNGFDKALNQIKTICKYIDLFSFQSICSPFCGFLKDEIKQAIFKSNFYFVSLPSQ